MSNNKPLQDPEKLIRMVDEQTAKRVHEHLTNKNDHITDEDLKNVKTSFNDPDTMQIIVSSETDEKQNTQKIKDNEDPGIETSWNVLDSQ